MEYYILKVKKVEGATSVKYIKAIHEREVEADPNSVNPDLKAKYRIDTTEDIKEALMLPTLASANNLVAEHALEKLVSIEYQRS